MKIIPLAADSMGARSMATFVETGQRKILIDPGAGLGASRYGLPPHELEEFQLNKHLERIRLYAESVQIIIITQFVREHLFPEATEMFRDKVLFIKNPNRDIPPDQRNRAFAFLEEIKGLSREIIYADGRSFETGGLRLTFASPYVLTETETPTVSLPSVIQEGETTFFFSSECLGMFREPVKRIMMKTNPTILYLDGPAAYLHARGADPDGWKQFQSDLEALLEMTAVRQIILDHHFARDPGCEKRMKPLAQMAHNHGVVLQTAAEFRGEQNDLLEARRKQLHEEDKHAPRRDAGKDGAGMPPR
ncbi:MAG TPA: hypothetical protein ENN17_04080 [bacterium]|nr:hypothetical protein [bacterium]